MAGDFAARMDELIEATGDGTLTGSVVVDQVYAKYQHERMDLKHPRGGHAKYLSGPLLEHHHGYLRDLADAVLGTGTLQDVMAKSMEDLAGPKLFHAAPREFWDLRESGHPRVNDGNALVYDRLPIVHRLTEGELKVKSRLRSQGLGGGGEPL